MLSTGIDSSTIVQKLLSYQNADGGFGELAGYQSTVIDTAHALKTLVLANAPEEPIQYALSYLMHNQQANGSWYEGSNQDSVYLTSLAMHSIWLLRHRYNLENELGLARHYLESQKSGGLWNEIHQSAQVLIALAPMYDSNESLGNSIDALYALQQPNGSWENDPYTTALVLQALALTKRQVPNPDLASISGNIVDSDNNIAIPDATITLVSSEGSQTIRAGSDGSFTFRALREGSYSLSFKADGYSLVNSTFALEHGEVKELGSIFLVQASTDSSQGITLQSITLHGNVTDKRTGEGLQGVRISYAEQDVFTDAAGHYVLRSDVTGQGSVQAYKEGYITENLTLNFVSGTSYDYSPALKTSDVTVVPGNPYSLLFGVVRDANSSQPIDGVQILLTGNTNFLLKTDAEGSYNYEPINSGPLNLTMFKSGYKPLMLSLEVNEGEAIGFSPYLEPSTITQPKNIKGVVFDSIANVPLADAIVKVDINDSYFRSVQTDTDGYFELPNIDAEHVRLTYSKDKYKTLSYGMSMSADYLTGSTSVIDLGQVRLRPISADIILPDLVAMDMNISDLSSDPQMLTSEGSISFKIKNVGTSPSSKPFKAVAFFDADYNGEFNDANDTMVGMVDVNMTLSIEEAGTVTIPVKGKVPFSDAYFTVTVDSNRDIIEIDEKNNNILTTEAYNTVKNDVRDSKPVVKWQWRGDANTPSTYMRIYSHPVVVPLEDTNKDGAINERDVSSIVFSYLPQSRDLDGTLIALSGVDGHVLWRVERGAYNHRNGLMAADIDQDGFVEIITRVTNYGTPDYGKISLVAYEHDGSLKWKTEPGVIQHYAWVFHSGAISDLEGDGSPEILCDGYVFDNNGMVKWTFPTRFAYKPVIAADLDLDGVKEVIAEYGVYSSTGDLLWSTDFSSNQIIQSIAVANFDDDKYPEILYYGGSVWYLLNHDGSTVWGPVRSLANGLPPFVSGSGSIVNVDHDEKPEIVASNLVLKADGSYLWDNYMSGTYFENHGTDPSSFTEYSLAYDFNGDGRAEVFSFSTEEMSILNGQTGVEVVSMPSSGLERYKYPIVADLDHDGRAEIVNVESTLFGSEGGVTVWEEANGGWAGTRGIWNSPEYHVDDINDDGTVPKQEEPFWQTHNTFRVNPAYSPFKADATLSLLKLHDNGIGHPYSISVRVGNGGNLSLSEELAVAFYDGKPKAGGILLGYLNAGTIAPNRYVDLMFEGVTQLLNSEIYAVVDEAYIFREYDEDNNRLHISVMPQIPSGVITATTDRSVYGANQEMILLATVTNPGRLSYALTARLQMSDANGVTVENFAPVNLGLLASGEEKTISQMWSSATLLSGGYLLKATLLDTNGNIIDEDTAAFAIVPEGSDSDNLASLHIETDRQTYHTTDTVHLDELIQNLSLNAVISDASLNISVKNAMDNAVVYDTSVVLNDLPPEGMRRLFDSFELTNAAEGTYNVTGTLITDTGESISQTTMQFEVVSDLARSLLASVSVARTRVESGDPQHCIDSLRNMGTLAVTDQSMRQLLTNLDKNEIVTQTVLTVSLDAGAAVELEHNIETSALRAGSYACVLQTQVEGTWHILGHNYFTVTEPPVKLDVSISEGNKGRLLILLDEAEYEPNGPDEVPLPSHQRAYLEGVLENNGYAYTIVTDAASFETGFRSGMYNAYVLFSEEPKLSEQLQREMAEAVFRGEGLLIAGKHDQRNGRLDELAGASYKGKSVATDSLDMNSTLYELFLADDKLRIDTRDNQTLATFEPFGDTAVAYKEHYKGKALFTAFDLLLYATYSGDEYESLLLELLALVQNDEYRAEVSTTLPVTLTIDNLGVPVAGESVTLHYDADVDIIDAGDGYVDEAGTLHWNYSLLDANTTALSFWLWPKEPGTLTLESSIYYNRNGETTLFDQYTHDFEVGSTTTFDALLAEIELEDTRSYKQALENLQKAHDAEAKGQMNQAMDFALKCADELSAIGTPRADAIHYQLARAIKTLAMKQTTKQ